MQVVSGHLGNSSCTINALGYKCIASSLIIADSSDLTDMADIADLADLADLAVALLASSMLHVNYVESCN